MPEWWQAAFEQTDQIPSTLVIVERTLAALVLGFAVAASFTLTLGQRQAKTRTLSTTLVLLSVLIALVTVVIGNSVARAFGLVGALSIVRFRTVVEDTRDTAFVIFAVVVGMAAGAGYLVLGLVSLPIVTFAAFVMTWWDGRADAAKPFAGKLMVKISIGLDPHELLGPILDKHCSRAGLQAAGTGKQGAALEVVYAVQLRVASDVAHIVNELLRTEGVQAAELKAE